MARELYRLLDLINMEIMPVSLFFLGVTYPFNIIRFDKRLKIYLSISMRDTVSAIIHYFAF